MKIPSLLAAALILALPIGALAAPPAPALRIEQALQLALDHLKERGLADSHQVISMTLEDSSLTGGRQFWFARWSPAIKGDKTSESGLQINMDGTLARAISGGPNGTVRPDNPGSRRVGARSIR